MRVRNDSHSHTMVFKARGRLLARALAVLFIAAILAQFLHAVFAAELLKADAPDFALRSTSGKNIRLSEYRGEVVAVSFGASWCDECQTANHVLEKLGRESSAGTDPASDRLRLLAIDFDHDKGAAAGLAADLNGAFPVLHDPEGVVGRLYEVDTLPLIILVDRAGKVQDVREGFRPGDEAALRQKVARLMAE